MTKQNETVAKSGFVAIRKEAGERDVVLGVRFELAQAMDLVWADAHAIDPDYEGEPVTIDHDDGYYEYAVGEYSYTVQSTEVR